MMRQNGLRASSFVPVVDADPRVCDQLLDLLRLSDVAAYSEPSPGTTGVYRDHHVPSRRLDRLWVDRSETLRAREVLDRALPHLQAELEVAIRDGIPVNAEAVSREMLDQRAGAVPTGPPVITGNAAQANTAAPAGAVQPGTVQPSAVQPNAVQPGVTPAAASPGGTIPAGSVPAETVSNVLPNVSANGDLVPPSAELTTAGPAAGAEDGDQPPPDRRGFPPSTGRFPAEPDDEAVDLAWAAIVADFDLPATGPAPWPATEDVTTSRVARLRRGPRPGYGPADRPQQDMDGEHFVPPPPPALPRLDPMARVGWAAVVAGPIVLVLVVVFGQSLPGWVPLLGVFTLVGGFALLVSRLRPSSSDDDSDHHDGAVV